MKANNDTTGRLVILAGPSCVGKSPLAKALARSFPDLEQHLKPVVLYNSRSPRPGEQDGIDYHFRRRDEIERLRGQERRIVMEVRGDLQALDLDELRGLLRDGDAFFEGNPQVGRLLQSHEKLADVPRLSVFVAPLSKDEILFLREQGGVGVPDLLTDIMRRKLLRRTRRHQGEISLKDLETIERRASSAYCELQEAWHFDYVLPNHDGEDSENWEAFYHPLGDARKTLLAFVALLQGEMPPQAEKWNEGLLP